MISFSDLATKLGVTRPTVTGWVRRGLPWHGTQRRKQFEPQEVHDWLVNAGLASSAPAEAAEPAIDDQAIARNRHEVANHFGVSQRTVSDWMTEPTFPGRPAKPGRRDGYFPLRDIGVWLDAKRGNTPGADRNARGPQDRVASLRGDLLTLDYQERIGELVESAAVGRLLVRHINEARAILDPLPDRVLAALPAKTPERTRQRIRRQVQRDLHHAYRALAETLKGDQDPTDDKDGEPTAEK